MAPDNSYFQARPNLKTRWQRYSYRPNRRLGQSPSKKPAKLMVAAVVLTLLVILWWFYFWPRPEGDNLDLKHLSKAPPHKTDRLTKDDVRIILDGHLMANITDNQLYYDYNGYVYRFTTSIHKELQRFVLGSLNTAHVRSLGIVAIDPTDGRVLAMVSYDKKDPSRNACVGQQFPAASVFKIVTAAAAIEHQGLSADSPTPYNGGRHTLYRSQLKPANNKYTRHINLRKAFAQSVNPVFGKLGTRWLKKEVLSQYADQFGFNGPIAFEVPVTASHMDISEDPYAWAEIASGFNNDTTISVLHGAMMAATVVNQGEMMEPTLIDQIADENQNILYQNQAVPASRVITSATAAQMRQLMEETVRTGTARKAFRGYKRDKLLSQLKIGGKTGSIDNRTHEVRYDWFVGYGTTPQNSAQIAVGVMVAHEKYIGKRAGTYARLAIKEYFRENGRRAGLDLQPKSK